MNEKSCGYVCIGRYCITQTKRRSFKGTYIFLHIRQQMSHGRLAFSDPLLSLRCVMCAHSFVRIDREKVITSRNSIPELKHSYLFTGNCIPLCSSSSILDKHRNCWWRLSKDFAHFMSSILDPTFEKFKNVKLSFFYCFVVGRTWKQACGKTSIQS